MVQQMYTHTYMRFTVVDIVTVLLEYIIFLLCWNYAIDKENCDKIPFEQLFSYSSPKHCLHCT